MSFLKYLEDYEKKVKNSISESKKKKDSGKVGGKYSSPSQEVKNPVKTNMTGKKPKGTSDKQKFVKKVSQEVKNPVKTNMTGKKNSSPGNCFKNPSQEMGGGIKTGSPGKKPQGAGKVPKFNHKSPQQEVKNPVKSKTGKMVEHATNILDGINENYVVDRNIKSEEKNGESTNVVNKAASLL